MTGCELNFSMMRAALDFDGNLLLEIAVNAEPDAPVELPGGHERKLIAGREPEILEHKPAQTGQQCHSRRGLRSVTVSGAVELVEESQVAEPRRVLERYGLGQSGSVLEDRIGTTGPVTSQRELCAEEGV